MEKSLFERARELIQSFSYEDFMTMNGVPTARLLKFLDLMRQILQVDPDNAGALNNMAVLGRAVSLPEALQAAERLVQVNPCYDSYRLLGINLLEVGDSKRASVMLEEALALNSNSSLWIYLAQAKADTGRLQEALGCVENALRQADSEDEMETAIRLRDDLIKDLNRVHGGT
jgi:tetratricopeptide (TPR) repeat protein